MGTYLVYNENIISHRKCGFRYLNEQFNYDSNPPEYQMTDFLENGKYEKIKWVIIREPFDHFLSAVDTLFNDFEYMNKIHDVKSKDDLFYEVLKTFVMGNDDHWSPNFFKHVYILSKKVNLTMVHLNDLTNFIQSEIKLLPVLKTNKHTSRKNEGEEIKLKIDSYYPKMGNIIRNLIHDEMYFYNKLIEENNVFNPNKIF